jgi:hypothetical protein
VPVGPNGFQKGHRPAQPPPDSAPQAADTRLRLASVIAVTALPASAPPGIMRAPEPYTALHPDLGADTIRDALSAPLPRRRAMTNPGQAPKARALRGSDRAGLESCIFS